MRNFSIETLIILLLIVGSILAVIFNFYIVWFKPSVFQARAVRAVKDWWLFADYFQIILWLFLVALALEDHINGFVLAICVRIVQSHTRATKPSSLMAKTQDQRPTKWKSS